MNVTPSILILAFVAALSCGTLTTAAQPIQSRPNIVWIIPDDMSANFSCYGETAIQTLNVGKLAASGVKFTHAYVTAPVCSTCRSAFITGMYQTSIGAQHHRSGRGEKKIYLPEGIKLVPKLFQEAGYSTTISSWPVPKGKLDEVQELLFRDVRPAEELYDVNADPHEINNLADKAKFA